MQSLVILSIVFGAITLVRHLVKSFRNKGPKIFPLPPGPKRLPILGNYFDIPEKDPWVTMDAWFKKFGDMVYYEVFGQRILVLGSRKRAHDLFDKRAENYSDRPPRFMLNELSGWNFHFGGFSYGKWWKQHRRAFHQHFNMNVVSKYQPIHIRESHAFLLRLLNSPSGEPNVWHNIRHYFSAIIMDITYGYKLKESNDPFIEITNVALHCFAQASLPGRFLVDSFPSLRYIPSWFPGANFKRLAKKWKAATSEMVERPFEFVKTELRDGKLNTSAVASMLEDSKDLPPEQREEQETVYKNSSGIAFAGGADTTSSSVYTFFLAMTRSPEIQKKAQEEIDLVVGKDRLPDFTDKESLPYVEAIIKECLRWQNVAPLAVPHMSVQDDIYDGYFIPKGTIILGNAWSILHNPANYVEPLQFIPERFLKDGVIDRDVMDPTAAAFGFGRRICPGRYLSNESMFAIVASVLAAFDILAPLDDEGNPILPACEMSNGGLSYPKPFRCIVKPRSKAAEELIRNSAETTMSYFI